MAAFSEYTRLIAGVERMVADNRDTRKVDVVINVYGKPYNTAATLYSLLKHSGQWIDKIYFITEKRQPNNSGFDFITEAIGNRIVAYTPPLWLWVRPFRSKLLFRF